MLRSRSADLVGILNGADYTAWDPATDPLIPANFDERDLSGKRLCKRALIETFFPGKDFERPLLAIVSRLSGQKGFDLLMQVSHELLAEGVSLIVIGSGEQRFEEFFRWLAAAYSGRVAVQIGYDEAAARRIYAAADMILMPSRYEPCGLPQIYGMRYGALPLVRITGGLEDTVDRKTGFVFHEATGEALLRSFRSALQVYRTPRWREMMRAAMQRRFSWQAAGCEYIQLYRRLTSSSGSAARSTAG